jgi:cold shock CspA family protein
LLIDVEEYKYAKHQLEKVINFKNLNDQKISQEIMKITELDWYSDTDAEDIINYSLNYNSICNEIITEDIPKYKAIFSGHYLEKKMGFIAVSRGDNDIIELPIYYKDFPHLEFYDRGKPMMVKVDFSSNKPQILTCEERDGELFDTIPTYVGKVDHVNHEKELAHILFSKKMDCVAHFKEFSELKDIGMYQNVKCKIYRSKERYRIVSLEKTDEKTDWEIIIEFKGNVEIPDGKKFGFVRNVTGLNDIFIPPEVIVRENIESFDRIIGIAILNKNKKKNQWGWSMIKLLENLSN